MKKTLSVVLVVCMVLSLIPTIVFSAFAGNYITADVADTIFDGSSRQQQLNIDFNNLGAAPSVGSSFDGKIAGIQLLLSYDSTVLTLGGATTPLKSNDGVTDVAWDISAASPSVGTYRLCIDDSTLVGITLADITSGTLNVASFAAQFASTASLGTQTTLTITVESICDSTGNEAILSAFEATSTATIQYGINDGSVAYTTYDTDATASYILKNADRNLLKGIKPTKLDMQSEGWTMTSFDDSYLKLSDGFALKDNLSIDAKTVADNTYWRMTYDLGAAQDINELLIAGSSASTSATAHYKLYVADTVDQLYTSSSKVKIEYINSLSTLSQRFVLSSTVQGRYFGLEIWDAGQSDTIVRLSEVAVYSPTSAVSDYTVDTTVTDTAISDQSSSNLLKNATEYKAGWIYASSNNLADTTDRSYLVDGVAAPTSANGINMYNGLYTTVYNLGTSRDIKNICTSSYGTANSNYWLSDCSVYMGNSLDTLFSLSNRVIEYSVDNANKTKTQYFTFDSAKSGQYIAFVYPAGTTQNAKYVYPTELAAYADASAATYYNIKAQYESIGRADETQSVTAGTTVSFTAVKDVTYNGSQYSFSGWYKDNVLVSDSLTLYVIASASETYIAKYTVGEALFTILGTDATTAATAATQMTNNASSSLINGLIPTMSIYTVSTNTYAAGAIGGTSGGTYPVNSTDGIYNNKFAFGYSATGKYGVLTYDMGSTKAIGSFGVGQYGTSTSNWMPSYKIYVSNDLATLYNSTNQVAAVNSVYAAQVVTLSQSVSGRYVGIVICKESSWVYIGEFAVYAAPSTYGVTCAATANGTITTDKSSYAPGETVTVTVAPDSGYQLLANSLAAGTSIKVNLKSLSSNTGNSFTFTMPGKTIQISATFVANDLTPNFAVIGAQIRASGTTGLRFVTRFYGSSTQVKVNGNVYPIVEYGTLVIPNDLLTGSLTIDTQKVAIRPAQLKNIVTDNYFEFTAVLTGIPSSGYNREIASRGYIKYRINDTTYGYVYSNQIVRSYSAVYESIYGVAPSV